MTKSQGRYKSYLLRLWQENDGGQWRARLQAVDDESTILHFADVETLLGYLLRAPPAPAATSRETDDI